VGVECLLKQFYDDIMTTQMEVAEFVPKSGEVLDDLERDGGEISLTRDGKTIAKLVSVESASKTESARSEGRVFYNGRWMIPAAAERERSIEHLRGSGEIRGDIVSPIFENDGPLAGSILHEGDLISPLDLKWDATK
jgi:antitoxin (DNA-binding transcriptional repressor) of toxin-antitoxin stability system